jgi:hypothetical protein
VLERKKMNVLSKTDMGQELALEEKYFCGAT